MAIQTQELKRAFRYNSVKLPDPGPQYTLEQVRDMYAATYPEIVNAAVEGQEEKDGEMVYTFRRAVGTKGGADVRDQLKAIAAGRDPRLAAVLGAPTLSAVLVKQHQPAFRAWESFARSVLRGGGEPLAAPAETLTPLP